MPRVLRLKALLLFLVILPISGCRRLRPEPSAFYVKGTISSTGGAREPWSQMPGSCTRDSFLGPIEGAAPSGSRSVATFLWSDESKRAFRPNLYKRFGPESPLRLSVAQTGDGGNWAILTTMRHNRSTRFDATVCRTLTLDAHETPNPHHSSRPLLAGIFNMDCTVQGSHITANLNFSRCGF